MSRPGRLVLVGAPGSGKSEVGARLAARLGWAHVDVDAVIEAEQARSIAEIFADSGEQAFRALEEAAVGSVLTVSPAVVSLGGGAVLAATTRERLAAETVVWLQVSAAEAARRVGLNVARPLLLGNVRGRLAQLLKERLPLYAGCASHTVATDERSAEQVAEDVLAWWAGRGEP